MFDTIRQAGGRLLQTSRFGPAARFALWVILLSATGSAHALAPRSAIPTLDRCSFLELRMAEGWWLQIRKAEPAAYGFGALAKRVLVKEGTFTLDEVYRSIIDHVVAPYPDAPVTVLFSPMALGYEGWVFALEGDGRVVNELFATAYRERDQALADGFQQDAIPALDRFWTDAPFLQ